MIAIGLLFIRMLCDCFKSRPQLEVEIMVLRHQLNVLQQRAPRPAHLRWADRALFTWLYRRCSRILDAITIVKVRTHVSLGKDAPCRRPIERFGDIVSYPILGGLYDRYARI